MMVSDNMKERCNHIKDQVSCRKGFTLIELLVVVSIIALLVSILLPALGKAREQARQVACKSNLRQMGISLASYVSEYGRYPSYMDTTTWSASPSMDMWMGYYGSYYVTWQTMLMRAGCLPPVTEHAGEGSAHDFWRCPSTKGPYIDGKYRPTPPFSQYGLNAWLTYRQGNWPESILYTDGGRLLVGELDPDDQSTPCFVSPDNMQFRHSDRSNVLFFDSSVSDIAQSDSRVSDSRNALWLVRRDITP